MEIIKVKNLSVKYSVKYKFVVHYLFKLIIKLKYKYNICGVLWCIRVWISSQNK